MQSCAGLLMRATSQQKCNDAQLRNTATVIDKNINNNSIIIFFRFFKLGQWWGAFWHPSKNSVLSWHRVPFTVSKSLLSVTRTSRWRAHGFVFQGIKILGKYLINYWIGGKDKKKERNVLSLMQYFTGSKRMVSKYLLCSVSETAWAMEGVCLRSGRSHY